MIELQWRRGTFEGAALYKVTHGKIDALVFQRGELWEHHVYFEGSEVERGQFDSRADAFAQASAGVDHAIYLRDPTRFTQPDADLGSPFCDEDEED